ncbi:hypothetical protein MRB53_009315 [Persea americana]|uniref:Uncharacterized protein n=2 Tax=Persea americana TaxID=3435 RepID=A0ACC2LNR9_PERAE|nr:hypothetical protein MRB53_008737 [Persea americana]KAJ8635048.1 hypothetical protein MRB53_009315 [Persea americana]|eukprot:TRINITY_DN2423_c0_g1_i1.p1 TRINITY_DN2423_c0_g1~~TRINITY_DN2423_c0_g1_i1.p1  ORF type:complete len:176 (-),score=52.11 TRINITY_DN2423_c0_g1_i1:323-850(-)
MERDDDSDAPEELTAQQGIEQEEELRRVQKQNKIRVTQEGKERRRLWAQRKTQQSSAGGGAIEVSENKLHQETQDTLEMLPNDIVDLLASREKQVFHFDSEDEITNNKPTPKKKKLRNVGDKPVILKDIPPAECLHNSMDFLKKRKMKVPRSASVLKNSNQALRLLSTHGLLRNN